MYKDRESYFENIAATDTLLQHGQTNADGDIILSFFRINDLEEMEASCKNWIHNIVLVQMNFQGSDELRGGALKQRNKNILMVLAKLQRDENEPSKAKALTDAYDICFDVMQSIKAKMYEDADMEDEADCASPFIDVSNARWERTGPHGDEFYGFILEIDDITKAIK